MDEMFVPYKSSFEVLPEPVVEATTPSYWLWIVLSVAVILILAGAFLLRSTFILQKKSMSEHYSIPISEEPVKFEPIKFEPIKIEPVAEPVVKVPEPALIPPVIDFSEPAKLNTEKMSKEELAKFVGTEIKNLLVLYSGISSLQTASIVSFSVRTMLEDFAPILQPQSIPEKPKLEKIDEEFISTKVLQPRPQPTHLTLDADEEEETKDPPKKGKINADTDANLLQMLKQRGLS